MSEVKYAMSIIRGKLKNADEHNLHYQRFSIADMEAILGVLAKSESDYSALQQKLDLARDKYRAEGIAASINHLLNKFEGAGMIGVPVMSLQWLLKEITSGTHDTADKAG